MITLCVAYMVKNESANIEFSLNSVKTIADKIVVVDTGSTDDTIKKIQTWCDINKIEVKIYERKWVNFGYNRSELAVLTRHEATYTLFLDADMLVELDNFNKQELKADQYDLLIHWVGTGFYNPLLANNKLAFVSVGVVHEYWYAEGIKTREKLPSLNLNHDRHGLARPKGIPDLVLLEQGVKDEPNNSRYHFYLANTLRDVGQYEKAIEIFSKRISMGGWDEEVFYSKYQIGLCFELLNELNKAKIAYLKAWEYRPTRAEPLCKLAAICRKNGEYQQAYLFANKGMEIAFPKDIIFVDITTYNYVLRFERSISAYWLGKYEEAIKDCVYLDSLNNIPSEVRNVNRKNISYSEQKLFKKEYLITKFEGEKEHSSTPFCFRNPKLISRNIRDMKEIEKYFLYNFNLSLYLIYGTLLGAVRDNSFILDDNDIDFAYLSKFDTIAEVRQETEEIAWKLRHAGLLVKCHNNRGQLRVSSSNKKTVVDIWTSWIENGEYNIVPYRKIGIPEDVLPLGKKIFYSETFSIPNNSKKILNQIYKTWEIPVKRDGEWSNLTMWKGLDYHVGD